MTDDSSDESWHRYRDEMSVSARLAWLDGNRFLKGAYLDALYLAKYSLLLGVGPAL